MWFLERFVELFRRTQEQTKPTVDVRPNTGPRPCSREEALSRMLSLVGQDFPYVLGTGDIDGQTTRSDGKRGMDCAGAAQCYAYKVKRHRKGYNKGPWASVTDDVNTNSGIEDAEHGQEIWRIVTDYEDVLPGDLIAYPTIYVKGVKEPFIGHVQMVVKVPQWWRRKDGYSALTVAHCHGPTGRRPAVTIDNGGACDRHDAKWSKPEHRTRILRVVD